MPVVPMVSAAQPTVSPRASGFPDRALCEFTSARQFGVMRPSQIRHSPIGYETSSNC